MNSLFNIYDFGAKGDGKTYDTNSIQRSIDLCHKEGGGKVVIPSGKYLTGSIILKSNVELHLMNGAILSASSDITHHKHGAIIYAKNAQNISITGFGVIDGNHESYVVEEIQYHMSGSSNRPQMILFWGCKNVTISDITIQNAPEWTIHPVGCENTLIRNIKIFNNLKMANSDGIDPDHCKNMRIVGCTIHCADDCIVFKNTDRGREFGPCCNITVSGCNLVSTSSAIKFGSETVDLFKNIIITDCIINASNRALGIQLRDEGSVENVLFHNIIIETRRFYDRYWGRAEPIWITNIPRNNKIKTGHIKNITFSNIIAKCENGVFVQGTNEGDVSDICLENINLEIDKKSKWDGGVYDRRPAPTDSLIHDKTNGLRIDTAHNIHLKDIKVSWGENVQSYYGSALQCSNIKGLKIENFTGKGAHAEDDPIVLINNEMNK